MSCSTSYCSGANTEDISLKDAFRGAAPVCCDGRVPSLLTIARATNWNVSVTIAAVIGGPLAR